MRLLSRFAPLLLLAAAAWALRAALLSGGSLVPAAPYTDLAAQFAAWREYGFSELRQGRLAFWNPYLFCGIPFFAGFESALLYPPNWLHLALPLGWALNVVILLHLFMCGAATFGWLRARGRGVPAALAGGTLFMFCGPVYLRLYAGHLPVLCALAWVPVLFYCVETRSARLGAASVALQILAGNPQYAYFTALALVAFAWLRGSLRTLVWMYLGGLSIAAAQWLPGAAAAAESVRATASFDFTSRFALPLSSLVSLAWPAAVDSSQKFFWESSLAFGAAGTVLAAFGMFRPSREDRPLLWLAFGALILALGTATPLYALAYWTVPGLSMLRGIGKLSFVACLCLAAVAASGLERLAGRAKKNEAVSWLLAALVLFESLAFAAGGAATTDVARRYPGQWRDALDKVAPGERVLHDFTRFPNMGLLLRVGDLWGYSALAPQRYAELMATAQGLPRKDASQYLAWKRDAPAVLDLLRCRALLLGEPGSPPVWRKSPLSRAQAVWTWSVAPDADAALRQVTGPGFDPRARVALEDDPGLGQPAAVGGRTPAVAVAPDVDQVGAELSVEVARPAILLVTDSYSSGWRAAALPGSTQTSYRVLPADHALIGIPLSPGRHRLRLSYRPPGFMIGAWLSTLASAGWAALLVP